MLCRLSRQVAMYGKRDVAPFDFSSMYMYSRFDVAEAYWDTRQMYTGNLDWVGWDFASFTPENHKESVVEGSPRIATVYRAMVVQL